MGRNQGAVKMTVEETKDRITPLPEKIVFVSTPLRENDKYIENQFKDENSRKYYIPPNTTIYSNSLDTEKAPALFISARLSEIERKAKNGLSNTNDTLWLIQENRKRLEEGLRVENWIAGMRGRLTDALEKIIK